MERTGPPSTCRRALNRPGGGLNNGYGEVISDIWDVKEQKPTPIDKLATHIDEGRFDVLVLVSCERSVSPHSRRVSTAHPTRRSIGPSTTLKHPRIHRAPTLVILRLIADPPGDSKFMHHHQALRKSFAARQDLHVICLLHEVENFVKENEEQRGMMAVPAEQGRLTFVELSEHGASKVQAVVEGWSTDADQWEVDVVDFAPVSVGWITGAASEARAISHRCLWSVVSPVLTGTSRSSQHRSSH